MWRLIAEQLHWRWVPALAVVAVIPLAQLVAQLVSPSRWPLGPPGAATVVAMLLGGAAVVHAFVLTDSRQHRVVLLKSLPATDREIGLARVLLPAVLWMALAVATLLPAALLGLLELEAPGLWALTSSVLAVLALLEAELLWKELRPYVLRLPLGRPLSFAAPILVGAALAIAVAALLSRHREPAIAVLVAILQAPAALALAGAAVAMAAMTVVLFRRRESYLGCSGDTP